MCTTIFERRDVLYHCGFLLAALATLFHVLGMATPHWLESHDEISSTFDRLGLWSACFHNFAYDLDYLGKTYDGCHWIYSYEYKPVFDWLNPGWLVLVQVLMVMSLIVYDILLFVMLLQNLSDGRSKPRWLVLVQVLMVMSLIVDAILLFVMLLQKLSGGFKIRNRSITVLTNSAMMLLSTVMTGFCLTLFGVQARVSRQWMPRPDQNYLAWSYGLAVVGGFFAVFATMCLFTESQRLRFEEKNRARKAEFAEHERTLFPRAPNKEEGAAVQLQSYQIPRQPTTPMENKRLEAAELEYDNRYLGQPI